MDFIFRIKKCEALKELELNKDIKEDCINYIQLITMDSFEADGEELEQCWKSYMYHPNDNKDLQYMASYLIDSVWSDLPII